MPCQLNDMVNRYKLTINKTPYVLMKKSGCCEEVEECFGESFVV